MINLVNNMENSEHAYEDTITMGTVFAIKTVLQNTKKKKKIACVFSQSTAEGYRWFAAVRRLVTRETLSNHDGDVKKKKKNRHKIIALNGFTMVVQAHYKL